MLVIGVDTGCTLGNGFV